MIITRSLQLAALIFLASLVGCAAAPEAEPPMPFRVAIAPAQIEVLRPDQDPGFALGFTSEAVTTALTEALAADGSFVAVELIPLASNDRQELTREARARRADLLLEPYLESGPEIEHGINEKFWLNLPLFAIGGPLCYWVSDRRYDFEVNFQVTATSLASLPDDERVDLDRAQVFPRPLGERLQEVDMNFATRSGYRWSSVLVSLVWPAGLLERSGDGVRSALEEQILETVSGRIVKQLRGRESELCRLEPLAPFYVDLETVQVRRKGSEVQFECTVVLERQGGVDFLQSFRLQAGSRSREIPFGHPVLEEGVSRYRILEAVPLDEGISSLQLQITEASMDENRRSYTFPIPVSPGS